MTQRAFWLVAGPNGAGKSTLAKSSYFATLAVPKPLNPDDFTFGLLRQRGYLGFSDAPYELQRDCSIEAAEWVFAQVEMALANNEDVGVETVLSTEKYLPLFRQVVEKGGEANLIYVGNQSPAISVQRVAIRVQKGGHDVPIEKIHTRWHRSLKLLPSFWNLATQAWLFDYSDSSTIPQLIAHENLSAKGRSETTILAKDNLLTQNIAM